MEALDATAPLANAGPQTPKSAKNAKKRGRWALGAESAVGEFSKRARHSLSTLCTLRNSPAKSSSKHTPRGERDISELTAAELHAELDAMAQQENEQLQRSASSFMSPSKLAAPVSSPFASPLAHALANEGQSTASPSKQSFKPSSRAGVPKRNTPVQARQFRKTPSAMDFSTLQESSTPTLNVNAGSVASRTRSRARGGRAIDELQPAAPETPTSDRMSSLRGVATASAASLVSRTSSITLSLRSVANNVSNTDLTQLLTPRTLNALKEVSGSVRIKRNKLMDDIRNISDSLRRRAGDDDLADDAVVSATASSVALGPRHLFGHPLHIVMQRQQAFARGLAANAEPFEIAAAGEQIVDAELAALDVPAVLYYASELIRERYLHSVGLFRLSAAHAVINQVASAIDASTDSGKAEILTQRDANVIACVVKKWLRELPAPLLCPADRWLAIADSVVDSPTEQQPLEHEQPSSIVTVLREAIAALPEHNRNVLREILVLAKALALNAHINKMTACNLATVIAPNLLYSSDPFFSSTNITTVNTLVETIMNHADELFPERMAQLNFVVLPSPNSSSSICEPALAAQDGPSVSQPPVDEPVATEPSNE